MSKYIRLAEKPHLKHPGYPVCGACDIETELDDCEWLCPSCGTIWSANKLEYDPDDASLYEDWAGETPTGPTIPNDEAWQLGDLRGSERDAMITRLGLGETK